MTTETSTTKGPLTTNEAALQIAALRAPKKETPGPGKNAEKSAKSPTDKPEGNAKKPVKKPLKAAATEETSDEGDLDDPLLAGKSKAEDAETDDEALADEAEDHPEDGQDHEGDETEDSEEGNDDDEDDLHAVVVDGKEVKIPYKELVDGYMRHATFTKKTEALSRQRKEIETLQESVKDLPDVRKNYYEQGARFVNNAGLVIKALENKFMPPAPDAALRESDPKAYIAAKEAHQEGLNFVASLKREGAILEAQAFEDHKAKLIEGRKKLFEIEPEMQDPAHRARLINYAKQHGFTEEQIKAEPSPVIFQWALKAQKYDEIMQRKANLTSDKPKPKITPRSKATDDAQAVATRNRTKTLDNHSKSQSINSAAAAISAYRSK